MKAHNDSRDVSADGNKERSPLSRRHFVKGAIATAPMLATLPSGAALARSSNVIGSTYPTNATDRYGRTLCLDARSGSRVAGGIDLGQPPRGSLTAIPARDYRIDDADSAPPVTEAPMCYNGGSYYYKKNGDWTEVTVPKGLMVSATALYSFTGSIHVTEI